MKTKIFKTGLPIMAFLMAIGFAFATQNTNSSKDDLSRLGYIRQGNLCVPTPKMCDESNIVPCKYGGVQLYGSNNNGTTCPILLSHSSEF